MIEEPPVLKVRRNFKRPTAEQIKALSGTPTGFVADAMDGRGALGPEIRPVDPDRAAFCGAALTCHAGPGDNLAVLAAIAEAQPGDVIVSASDGYRMTAVIGDRLTGMARNKGAVAMIGDGCVRDVAGIRANGLPCFAAGTTPNSPAFSGPGTVGLPVTLAGESVHSGDVVIGDADGVVIVPFAEIDHVIERLAAIRQLEQELDAKVVAGLAVPDFVRELMAIDKVRIVEWNGQ
jgi:4-hydroxy-4-methyl-2-oxoglutarate aldolase